MEGGVEVGACCCSLEKRKSCGSLLDSEVTVRNTAEDWCRLLLCCASLPGASFGYSWNSGLFCFARLSLPLPTNATTTPPKSSRCHSYQSSGPAVLLKLCLLVAKCLREDTPPASSIWYPALRFFLRRHHSGQWPYFGP